MWAGRGINTSIAGGVRASYGSISLSIAPQLVGNCLFDPGPGQDLRIHRLLNHPIIEEAGCTIAFAVHGDQANIPRGGVERLRQPSRVAGNFFGPGSAGHAAL